MKTLRLVPVAICMLSLACDDDDVQPASGVTTPPEQSTRSMTPALPMPPVSGPGTRPVRSDCPTSVEGAEVAVSDTDEGAALTFTTKQGDVAALRARARYLARMYEAGGHHHMMWRRMGGPGRGHGHGMGPRGQHHPGMRGDVAALGDVRTTVTDVEDGARLELTPADASEVERLREAARRHQQRMSTGGCLTFTVRPGSDSPDAP